MGHASVDSSQKLPVSPDLTVSARIPGMRESSCCVVVTAHCVCVIAARCADKVDHLTHHCARVSVAGLGAWGNADPRVGGDGEPQVSHWRLSDRIRGLVMREDKPANFAELDDTALIEWRNEIREQLEHEPPNMADLVRAHHLLTTEVVGRTIAMRKKKGRRRELTGTALSRWRFSSVLLQAAA
jgi:hypothetical protein